MPNPTRSLLFQNLCWLPSHAEASSNCQPSHLTPADLSHGTLCLPPPPPLLSRSSPTKLTVTLAPCPCTRCPLGENSFTPHESSQIVALLMELLSLPSIAFVTLHCDCVFSELSTALGISQIGVHSQPLSNDHISTLVSHTYLHLFLNSF